MLRVALLCLLGAAVGVDAATTFQFTGNPMEKYVSAADPDCHLWDGTVWCYTSTDGNLLANGKTKADAWTYEFMEGYRVFSSTDMINWVDHGEIFNSNDCPWGTYGWMWAPAAVKSNGKYYLYYPKKDKSLVWRVGIAIGDSPTGPFTDVGKPLDGMAGIDPSVFIDDDGSAYMYLNDHQVAKMKPNMIELAEAPRFVDYGPDSVKNDIDKKFEEGSFVFKRNGKYYYTYSNWQEDGPTAYYGVGDSPYGPFDWKGELAGKTASAPDHHSIIQFRGEYYYFYHMDTPWQEKDTYGWHGHRRIPCYDRMLFNSDNTIQPVVRTYGQPVFIPPEYSDPCVLTPCQSWNTCVDKGDGTRQCIYNDPCATNPCTEESQTCLDQGRGQFACVKKDTQDSNFLTAWIQWFVNLLVSLFSLGILRQTQAPGN